MPFTSVFPMSFVMAPLSLLSSILMIQCKKRLTRIKYLICLIDQMSSSLVFPIARQFSAINFLQAIAFNMLFVLQIMLLRWNYGHCVQIKYTSILLGIEVLSVIRMKQWKIQSFLLILRITSIGILTMTTNLDLD